MRSILKLLAAACLIATATSQGARAGELNFLYGKRSVDSDFDPVDDQKPYGINLFIGGKDEHLALALGAYRADEDASFLGGSTEVTFTEISVGIAKIWGKVVRPYLGAGATYLKVEEKVTLLGLSADDDDRVAAPYGNAGIIFRLGKTFNIGVDARIVPRAKVSLFGSDDDADYRQYAALAGWGW